MIIKKIISANRRYQEELETERTIGSCGSEKK